MKYRIIMLITAVLILLIPVAVVFPENFSDQIMSADIPFTYGEESFIKRIEQRSEGRKPVGLVLSGGSARAFAHIGVLRRMEELGIVPDYIVANSMGSIVGLLYGAGFSPDQIAEIIQSTDIGELFKMTLPVGGGIIDVGKFSGLLYNFTGEIDLSELPVPVMVLCEDLKTKRLVKIAEGDLTTVMQAAYALPVYFDPVVYGDHLLIDGGIANLVPLDAAYEYSDVVIASTAFYQNPKLNLRNPITNINVALDIGKSRTGVSQIKLYDPLLIRCDVESFSFMEFGSLPEIQAAGYKSADEMKGALGALDAGGITEELSGIRMKNQVKMDRAVKEYRHLESLPVLDPALLVTTRLDIFNSPRSMRYLNDDLRISGGLDFSYAYFTAALTGGIGIDLMTPDSVFPAADFRTAWDLTHYLRLNFDYGLRLDPSGFSDPGNTAGVFGSSDIFAALSFVPLASGHLSLGLLASGEMAFEGLSTPLESLVTVQTEFTAATNPLSEDNLTADIIIGGQLANYSSSFNLDNPAVFGDLDFSIPLPGSSGTFKWKIRGFSRRGLNGGRVKSFARDGMRTSMTDLEASSVSFASTDLVFNPFEFRPAVAEVFMFKEIELSAFGEIGWIDRMFWSSGLALRLDLSLIGLKPVSLSGFSGYDSATGGIIGGITIIR